MGKRQVGELHPGELVITMIISELAAIPMQDLSRPLLNALIPLCALAAFELFLSGLALKIPFFRRTIAGKPAIVINNGKIEQKTMSQLRMTIHDLEEALRGAGYFNIEDIAYAIMETNGKISFMPKQAATPLVRGDINLDAPEIGLPRTVILDGKLQKHAFTFDKLSEKSVIDEVNRRNLTVENIFWMIADTNGNFVLIKKENP